MEPLPARILFDLRIAPAPTTPSRTARLLASCPEPGACGWTPKAG
jgi:hypothetical protein